MCCCHVVPFEVLQVSVVHTSSLYHFPITYEENQKLLSKLITNVIKEALEISDMQSPKITENIFLNNPAVPIVNVGLSVRNIKRDELCLELEVCMPVNFNQINK